MDASLLCGVSMSEGESNNEERKFVDKPSDCENKQQFYCSDIVDSTSQVQIERPSVEDYEDEEDENGGLSEEVLLVQMGYDKSLCESDGIEDKQWQCSGHEEEKEVEDELLELEELARDKVDAMPTALKGSYEKEGKSAMECSVDTAPTASRNIVSALKGSREKEGKPALECRVSWDPDVYDPIPAPPEEFAIDNFESEQRSSAGKNRQKKGKGGGRKGADKSKDDGKADKKKGKKRGGSSGRRRAFDDC